MPITAYRDSFGNWCSRIVAPPGEMRISTHAIINDSGLPNPVDTRALQHSAEDLPAETLMVTTHPPALRNSDRLKA